MLAVVLRGLSGQRGGVQSAKGYSSVGRAAVSKTAGRKFEPYCPCHLLEWTARLFRSVPFGEATMANFVKLRFPSCIFGNRCLCRVQQTRGAWG